MRNLFTIIFSLLFLFACTGQQQGSKKNVTSGNLLGNESSPYLLQHAQNPVHWKPWGNVAKQLAKDENKLMIISVGYAACHWCHVMEHESFEDSTVAAMMNENFVSIKVDREERPDVDDIYMTACQLMSKRGCGWPLNAIALPDGRPIFVGTYFQKAQWLDILKQVHEFYETKPEEALKIAGQVTEGIQGLENISRFQGDTQFFEQEREDMMTRFLATLDQVNGGRSGKPKFPMPANYLYALSYYDQAQREETREAILLTLDKMADGGIYDHLGGGFARYSTDAIWKVPHFEKMLYDNGQLVSLYSQAWQLTGKERYKEVVYESLDFIKREMTNEVGGFYSSYDADSEGEEGKFYVFSAEEIRTLLGDEAEIFAEAYNVKGNGNWEGSNILFRTSTDAEIAARHDMTPEALHEQLKANRAKLLAYRNQRVYPGLDDKVITSWNGLMLKGYVDAYRAFGEQAFLKAALRNANFILENCVQKDNSLTRIYKDEKSTINGFLDDYAQTASAFIALYQATFDAQWLQEADKLAAYAIAHFYDETSGMFYFSSDQDDPLIVRKMETTDNVIPSSNSTMAHVLFELGTFLYKEDYLNKAQQMLKNVKDDVTQNPMYFANWARLMQNYIKAPYEVAIVGPGWESARKELDQAFHPTALLMGGAEEGELPLLQNKLVPDQTTIYVCQNKVCKLPVTSVKEALKLMK